jgi:hypothetical protein
MEKILKKCHDPIRNNFTFFFHILISLSCWIGIPAATEAVLFCGKG